MLSWVALADRLRISVTFERGISSLEKLESQMTNLKLPIFAVCLCLLLIGVALAQRPRTLNDEPATPTKTTPTPPPAPSTFKAKYEGGVFGHPNKMSGTLTLDDANNRLVFRDGKQKE